jgi:hypothetical protein
MIRTSAASIARIHARSQVAKWDGFSDLEASHEAQESGILVLRVPVTSYCYGVRLLEHGIEDRLVRKSR